jgi:hypothetical protein
MTGREPGGRPLVAGGQGRTAREVVVGARVVALCAAGVLAVWLARVLGAL